MSQLIAQDIFFGYGGRNVLNGASLTLNRGEVLGLVGANGAGKTTLLRVLSGLLPVQKGRVSLDGARLGAEAEVARKLAYLEQRASCEWPLAVRAVVSLGRLPHQGFWRKDTPEDVAAVEQALTETDALPFADRAVNALSGGEQARVFLARALAVQADWLLADEPVAGLDPAHQLHVMELFRRKAAEGMGIVASLHDLSLAARFCDRLALLHEGQVLAVGTPDAVLTDENLRLALGVAAYRATQDGASIILPWKASTPLL